MQDAYKPRNPRRGRIRVRLFSLVALALALGAILQPGIPTLGADQIRLTGSFSFSDSGTCSDPLQVEGWYDEMLHIFYD